jgi:hypothetical protein
MSAHCYNCGCPMPDARVEVVCPECYQAVAEIRMIDDSGPPSGQPPKEPRADAGYVVDQADGRQLAWNPEIILRVARAIGKELFADRPEECMDRLLILGAARALGAIGEQISKEAGDGSSIVLPHPSIVFGVPAEPDGG